MKKMVVPIGKFIYNFLFHLLRILKRLPFVLLKPSNLFSKTDYLFIISHMRSRSTVLAHILGSNPGIWGYSELHNSYSGRLSLLKMKVDLCNSLDCEFKDKYLLDKLLHNQYVVSKKIYDVAKPKILFLLRKPESTIKSMIHMGHLVGINWYKDPILAMEYYCSRLLDMEAYAKNVAGDFFFIESEELVNHTIPVLESLSRWLKLPEPLQKEYSQFRNTGGKGHGDPSANIKTGILKKTTKHSHIHIPQEVLDPARLAYDRCREKLVELSGCRTEPLNSVTGSLLNGRIE